MLLGQRAMGLLYERILIESYVGFGGKLARVDSSLFYIYGLLLVKYIFFPTRIMVWKNKYIYMHWVDAALAYI